MADLTALDKRFAKSPGYAAWRARQEQPPADAPTINREREFERMKDDLAVITRRRTFGGARAMAASKWKRQPNWVFAKELFGVGSTYAFALCHEMGIDPDGTAA